jgi:hypothetical protein
MAQHRWLEPAIGLAALLGTGRLYLLGFDVLNETAALALLGVWAAYVVGGAVLWLRRPCTVLRLPAHAVLVWIAVVATAGVTGIAK